jgi:hypothetical protein
MVLKTWDELSSVQQQCVRARFVHWHYDTMSLTFEEWAGKHAFYITNKGALSLHHRQCMPAWMAKVERESYTHAS